MLIGKELMGNHGLLRITGCVQQTTKTLELIHNYQIRFQLIQTYLGKSNPQLVD